jgi:chromosome segregation ATPase
MDAPELPDVSGEESSIQAALRDLEHNYVELPAFQVEAAALLGELAEASANLKALFIEGITIAGAAESTRRATEEAITESEVLLTSTRAANADAARSATDSADTANRIASNGSALADLRSTVAGMEAVKHVGSDWTDNQVVQRTALEEEAARASVAAEQAARDEAEARRERDELMAFLESEGRERSRLDKEVAALREALEAGHMDAAQAVRTKDARDKELRALVSANVRATQTLQARAAAAEAGARDISAVQAALRAERSTLDKTVDEIDKLRASARRMRVDLDDVMASNVTLAKELAELQEKSVVLRMEATRSATASERFSKLTALTADKLREAASALAEVEAANDGKTQRLKELTAQAKTVVIEAEGARARLGDVTREAAAVSSGLVKEHDKVKAAAAALHFQQGSSKALAEQISGLKSSIRRLRTALEAAGADRDHLSAEVDDAGRTYFAALEGLKLQELQASALTKSIADMGERLTSQQSLADAVKADRSAYGKALGTSHVVLGDLKARFTALTARIDALKSAISIKDTLLVKEHFEHHRVEKEKDTLKGELARLVKSVSSCEHISSAQHAEVGKLSTVIRQAETESSRQRAELEAVGGERLLLLNQLEKRNVEVTALYEKLRVQKSMLANGAAAFARRVAERDALVAKLASVKGELLLATSMSSDTSSLRAEAGRLEEDLRTEAHKQRALNDVLDKPINVHRWRALADKDPVRWELLQRTHMLQKRLLAARDEVAAAEEVIAAKRAEVEATRPSATSETREAIAALSAAVKGKTAQAKALEAEVSSARATVEEYKREEARLAEAQEALASEWAQRQRRERRATGVGGGLAAAAREAVELGLAMRAVAEGKE